MSTLFSLILIPTLFALIVDLLTWVKSLFRRPPQSQATLHKWTPEQTVSEPLVSASGD